MNWKNISMDYLSIMKKILNYDNLLILFYLIGIFLGFIGILHLYNVRKGVGILSKKDEAEYYYHCLCNKYKPNTYFSQNYIKFLNLKGIKIEKKDLDEIRDTLDRKLITNLYYYFFKEKKLIINLNFINKIGIKIINLINSIKYFFLSI